VVDAKQLAQSVEKGIQQLGQIFGVSHAFGQQARIRRDVDARCGGRHLLASGHPPQLVHAIDVGTAQVKYLVHAEWLATPINFARNRSNTGPGSLSAKVFELQHHAGAAVWIVERESGAFGREHVLAAAIEELIGEGDVQRIDVFGQRE
jgi:hypothetical protein